jgi:hypothetical protein
MFRQPISRRQFLTLPLALLLAPVGLSLSRAGGGTGRAWAQPESRKASYAVDVGILYGLLAFHLDGALNEAVDRATGRYDVRMAGEGDGIANRIESRGVFQDGRWTPRETHSWFSVKGRESRSDVAYDWTRRTIAYHFRGETFFLRRLRVADDLVPVPEAVHVDDAISATLNYADGRWPPRGDGSYQTHVIRRKKAETEGPDDVQTSYRAELVPLVLRVLPDPESGKFTALFDLTRFSSWAKQGQPARVTFGPDRRPEAMTMPMILGTSVKIHLRGT